MLNGLKFSLDPVQEALHGLALSGHVFHLTGSRYFGLANEKSDYDFFVQGTLGLPYDLRAMGFQEIPVRETADYGDSQTTAVFRKNVEVYPKSGSAGGVQFATNYQFDIQIVRDENVKIIAQRILLGECPELVSGQKNARIHTRLWSYAYCMANTIIASKNTPAI